MTSNTIVSLALLKANWDLKRKSYLDNFTVLVAEAIRRTAEEAVSLSQVQDNLRADFGLELPQNSIHTILPRVSKAGYITLNDGIYRPNWDALSTLNFSDVQQEAIRLERVLVRRLVKFCEKFNITWSSEQAESALIGYLQKNQETIAFARHRGTVIPDREAPLPQSDSYLVARFLTSLSGDDPEAVMVQRQMENRPLTLSDNQHGPAHLELRLATRHLPGLARGGQLTAAVDHNPAVQPL